MKNNQNRRKNAKSSDREKIYATTKRHYRSDHGSLPSETAKNSVCVSPKVGIKNPFMEKYKTYIDFVTSNKIPLTEVSNARHTDAFQKKKAITPTPRRNSPVPYHHGRKSVFTKLSHQNQNNMVSPKSLGVTQEYLSNFGKKKSTERSNKPSKNPFLVQGNSAHQRKQSREIKQVRKQKKDKGEVYKRQKHSFNKKKQQLTIKGKKKLLKDKNEINKESLDSEYKLEEQEDRLVEKLFKGIQFYRDLGKGAHALVKSAVDWNTKRKIAVKIYEKGQLTEEQVKSIERQIEILSGLNHPSIIKLYEIIETYKTINLIMQYGGGNSLEQYMRSRSEGKLCQKQARHIFKQVLEAVKYLHEMKITHRDIKTENILLNKHLELKIIDFGFSLICYPNKNISSYCGTPTYMPPEVVTKTPHNPQLADRWSLGILLYTILNGHCPFRASTQKQLFQKINIGFYEHQEGINPLAEELIEQFLRKRPEDRLSPSEALNHPWMNPNESAHFMYPH